MFLNSSWEAEVCVHVHVYVHTCIFEEESKTFCRTIICYFFVDFSGDLVVPEMTLMQPEEKKRT